MKKPFPYTNAYDPIVACGRSKGGKAGGTHHGAVVYGDVCNEIEEFGRLMGWKAVRIN